MALAPAFGSFDLSTRIQTDQDGAVPFWELNDPLIRTPLAYGAESIQDSGLRTMTMTLSLLLTSTAEFAALRALSGTTAALAYGDVVWLNVTLTLTGSPRVFVDGTVECAVRLTKSGWALP